MKKDIVSKKVPKTPKVVLKQYESVYAYQTNTTSKDSDIPRASGSEVQVKQEFVDIRKLINDNFKTVLTTINSKQNEQEVRHSDDPIVPPNLNDEERYRSPYTSIPEVISNQVHVVQFDKLESGNLETINIPYVSDTKSVVPQTINNPDGIGSKSDDHEVNLPSFAFDIPQKTVLGDSEKHMNTMRNNSHVQSLSRLWIL
ncbi:hypothetical protein H5410_006928 [Solanum commersonii]|uniref:Uncharacterized protein n=1 Tax=Solanum commersonii TaxID=4109 RepID=A0A9J6AAH6_SOLCO|nr:hypothetical protein H5410_006928 [Solanum commersonii]